MRRWEEVKATDPLTESLHDCEGVFAPADEGKSMPIAGVLDNDYGIELSVAWANLGNGKPFPNPARGLDIADFVKDAQGDAQAIERSPNPPNQARGFAVS